MLVSAGFNDHHMFPFTELRKSAGVYWEAERRKLEVDQGNINQVVEQKIYTS